MWTITNPRLLLLIGLAECPQVGLRRDSSSAGHRFDPYMAHQIKLTRAVRLTIKAHGYTPPAVSLSRTQLSLNEFVQSPSGFEGFGYISFTGTMAS